MAGQWAIFFLAFVYTAGWARGVWNFWIKPYLLGYRKGDRTLTPKQYVVQLGDDLYGPFGSKEDAFEWAKRRDGPVVILEVSAP